MSAVLTRVLKVAAWITLHRTRANAMKAIMELIANTV